MELNQAFCASSKKKLYPHHQKAQDLNQLEAVLKFDIKIGLQNAVFYWYYKCHKHYFFTVYIWYNVWNLSISDDSKNNPENCASIMCCGWNW